MSPSTQQLAAAAAAVLQRDGWVQGELHGEVGSRPAHCLVGGVWRAATETSYSTHAAQMRDIMLVLGAVWRCISTHYPEHTAEITKYLRETKSHHNFITYIEEWNDEHATPDDVLLILEKIVAEL